ncbi:MAG: hypothetical protein MZU84_03810 [Sphingobacterium sp.]|nr:hypothetical protein [Sphingobacterium sp.]
MLAQNALFNKEDIEKVFVTNANKKDPWTLRKEALERCLSGEELSQVLVHIAKEEGL